MASTRRSSEEATGAKAMTTTSSVNGTAVSPGRLLRGR